MTPLAKWIAAGLLAAPLATPVAAQTMGDLSAYEVMTLRMQIREAVTDSVIDYYNSTEVVEDTSAAEDVVPNLQSGQAIPADVEVQPIPEELAEMLPNIGATWGRVFNHLVAVDDGVARVVVWEVLP